EADRGHAVAPLFKTGLRGGLHLRLLRKAEIIVGAEIDEPAAAAHAHLGALRRRDDTLFLVEAGFANARELTLKMLFERAVHVRSPSSSWTCGARPGSRATGGVLEPLDPGHAPRARDDVNPSSKSLCPIYPPASSQSPSRSLDTGSDE